MLQYFVFALLISERVLAKDLRYGHQIFHTKRATSPNNICGGTTGFMCDASSPYGGPCCSANGYCGSTDAYCGAGCQAEFGTCSNSPASINPNPSTSASSSPTAAPGRGYFVDNVGTFMYNDTYTFESGNLPAGLKITNGQNSPATPGARFAHRMTSSSVSFPDGYLHLTVTGGQDSDPIKGGEVSTSISDILYASVRTTAIFSPVPGTCHGLFFYKSDTQEIDIEYLTDPHSTSNPGNGSIPLQLTNQPADGVHADESHQRYPAPGTATSEEHVYRIDWTEGKTVFYVDGVQAEVFTKNVPTQAGTWLWNNWSNGDKGWSAGPALQNNTLKIKRIEMFYNRTGI